MFEFLSSLEKIDDVPDKFRSLYVKKEDGTGYEIDADFTLFAY